MIAERGGEIAEMLMMSMMLFGRQGMARREMATACMALVDFNPEGRSSGERKARLGWGRG